MNLEKLSADFWSDVLLTAMEAGTTYWATCRFELSPGPIVQILVKPDSPSFPVLADGSVDARDDWQIIDHQRLEDAVHSVLAFRLQVSPSIRESIHTAVRDMDAGNIDADASDVVVQIAAFGEIVFA